MLRYLYKYRGLTTYVGLGFLVDFGDSLFKVFGAVLVAIAVMVAGGVE